jgi:hypothetical protein
MMQKLKKYDMELLKNIKEMTNTLRFLNFLEELYTVDFDTYTKDLTNYTGILVFINIFEMHREDHYIHICRMYLQFNKSVTKYHVQHRLMCTRKDIK